MDGRRSPTPYFRSPMVATIHAMTSRPSMLLRAVLMLLMLSVWCAPNSVNAARQFQKDVCTSSAPLQAAEEEEADPATTGCMTLPRLSCCPPPSLKCCAPMRRTPSRRTRCAACPYLRLRRAPERLIRLRHIT